MGAAIPAPATQPSGLYTFLAEGLPDGMYAVDLHEDGSTRFELIEALNTTSIGEPL